MRLIDDFTSIQEGTVIEPMPGYMFAWDFLTEVKPKITPGEYVLYKNTKYVIKTLVDKNNVVLSGLGSQYHFELALTKDLKGTHYIAKTHLLAARGSFKVISSPLAIGQWRKRPGVTKLKIKALYEDKAVVGGPGWQDHILKQEELLKYDLINVA